MSNLTPIATYNLALQPFQPVPAIEDDFPISIRITLASLDPEAADDKAEPSSLRILKKSNSLLSDDYFEDDDDDEEEDDDEDELDDEEEEEEKSSKKSNGKSPVRKMKMKKMTMRKKTMKTTMKMKMTFLNTLFVLYHQNINTNKLLI